MDFRLLFNSHYLHTWIDTTSIRNVLWHKLQSYSAQGILNMPLDAYFKYYGVGQKKVNRVILAETDFEGVQGRANHVTLINKQDEVINDFKLYWILCEKDTYIDAVERLCLAFIMPKRYRESAEINKKIFCMTLGVGGRQFTDEDIMERLKLTRKGYYVRVNNINNILFEELGWNLPLLSSLTYQKAKELLFQLYTDFRNQKLPAKVEMLLFLREEYVTELFSLTGSRGSSDQLEDKAKLLDRIEKEQDLLEEIAGFADPSYHLDDKIAGYMQALDTLFSNPLLYYSHLEELVRTRGTAQLVVLEVKEKIKLLSELRKDIS